MVRALIYRNHQSTKPSKKFYARADIISEDGIEKTVRIVVTSGLVNHSKFLSGIRESLWPALERTGASDTFGQFESMFEGVSRCSVPHIANGCWPSCPGKIALLATGAIPQGHGDGFHDHAIGRFGGAHRQHGGTWLCWLEGVMFSNYARSIFDNILSYHHSKYSFCTRWAP